MRSSTRSTQWISTIVTCASLLIFSLPAMATHPLITDDTGTQGKGKFLIEFNVEFGRDKETLDEVTTRSKNGEVETLFSVGAAETVDLIFGLPYRWNRVKENDEITSDERDLSDFSLEMKWRFWETEGLSLALKPGVTFPAGDEERGMGTGKVTGSLYLITTVEGGPWAFHFNAGYLRNENELEERKDLWHLSLAAEFEVVKDLKLVGNVGMERNPGKDTDHNPAFILGGVVYSVTENLDIDLGIKVGLNHVETDYALLAGLAFRF